MRRGVPSAQRRPWPASAARGRPAPRPDGSPRATCSCLPSCRRAPGRQGQPPSPDWFAVSPAPSAGRLQARAGHLCAHLYRGFDLSILPLRPRRRCCCSSSSSSQLLLLLYGHMRRRRRRRRRLARRRLLALERRLLVCLSARDRRRVGERSDASGRESERASTPPLLFELCLQPPGLGGSHRVVT